MKTNLVQMFGRCGISASWLIIPIYAKMVGCDDMALGLVGAVYGLTVFFSSFIFGRISDIKGRKAILQAGLLASAVAFLLQVFARDPFSLAMARAFCGFCVGIYPPALIAYAHESRKLLGKFSSLGSLGWMIGSLSAGVIAAVFGALDVMVFSAAAFFAGFLITLTIKEGPFVARKVDMFPRSVIKKNLYIYLPYFIRHGGAQTVWIIFPLFLMDKGIGVGMIGVLFSINTGTQFVFMQFSDRFKPHGLLPIGFAATFLTFVILIFSPNIWWIAISQFVLGISWGTLYSGSVRVLAEGNVEKATSQGMLEASISLSGVFGPFIGGMIAFYYGYYGPLYLAAACSLLALAAYLYLVKRARGRIDLPSLAERTGPGIAS